MSLHSTFPLSRRWSSSHAPPRPRPVSDTRNANSFSAVASARDPTGTGLIRRRWNGEVNRRFENLARQSRDFLLARDHLGLGPPFVGSLRLGSSQSEKIEAFAKWFGNAAKLAVVGHDGSWIDQHVASAYAKGAHDGAARVKRDPSIDPARQAKLSALARNELNGIAAETVRQAVRHLAANLDKTPMLAYRAVRDRINAVGVNRGKLLVSVATSAAHADASLDQYAKAGVQKVGVKAEKLPAPHFHDAPRRRMPWNRRRELVGVQTAGDDLVCPECQELEDGGPYSIPEAVGLIPAHPRCRCAVVPYEDLQTDEWDPDKHPRAPAGSSEGGQFASAGETGEGAVKDKPKSTAPAAKPPAPEPIPLSQMRDYKPSEMDWEFGTEYMKYSRPHFPDAFKDRADFDKQFAAAPLRHLSLDELRHLGNSMAATGWGQNIAWAKQTFGHRRDVDRIVSAIKEGNSAPPIILGYKDKQGRDRLWLMAGQTRLATSLALGKNMPAKVISLQPPVPEKAAALLRRDGTAANIGRLIEKNNAQTQIAMAEEKLKTAVSTMASVDDGGHVQTDGSFTPERRDLHRQILAKMFTPDAISRATPGEGQKPLMTVLGGRGGSGKGWFTANGLVNKNNAIYINSDDFKEALPEYQGWNAGMLHDEANYLANVANKIAVQRGLNVIHDATMRTSGSIGKLVAEYKQNGYRVEGYYMYAPPAVAVDRAIKRFLSKGRYVPPSYVANSVTNEKTFDSFIPQFDKWAVYDNSGDHPRPYAHGP